MDRAKWKRRVQSPARPVEPAERIHTFFHCATCFRVKPPDQSPREWNRTECGLTADGLEVVCLRCGQSVVRLTPSELADWVAGGPRCSGPGHVGSS